MRPLLLLACLALVLAAAEPAIGGPAPDLGAKRSLNNPAGKGPVKLESFLGKVVLIDFWATWCGPCKAAIPHVRELHEKYADRGLVVIGHTDESSQGLEDFVKKFPIPYLVTVGDKVFSEAWGVTGIPRVFIIDPDGKVAWTGHPAELQEKTITDLLAKVKPSWPPAPRFAKAAAEPKVAALEQQASAGKVGTASKALDKLVAAAKQPAADAAAASLERIAAWKTEQDAALDKQAADGDVWGAWHLAEALGEAWRGHDDGKAYAERAATLKKDPGYEAGKDFQKLLAVPLAGRRAPGFAKQVDAFLAKHPDGYYAVQARALAP